MKKILIWCLCFLLLVAVIPAVAGIKGFEGTEDNRIQSADSTDTSQSESDSAAEIDHIICNVMEYITEESPAEAKKAILAICINNFAYCKSKGLSPDETDVSKYSDEFYEELCGLYEELDLKITLSGDTVYIPLTKLTGEHTSTSDEYPYMQSVASPWDVYSSEYNADRDYPCGVSVYGIGYLCESGCNSTEALRWYLPKFDISQGQS